MIAATVALQRWRTLEWKRSAALIAIGAAAYGVLVPVTPYLSERIHAPAQRNPLGTEYTIPWNKLQQQPNTEDVVPVQIRNIGVSRWPAQGASRVAVAYRWWNVQTESFVKDGLPIITDLPHDVNRGETVELQAAIRTPEQPGNYVLLVELFSRDFDWFSHTGLYPAMISADIRPAIPRTTGQTDMSRFYDRERTKRAETGQPPGETLTAAVSRRSLWSAALKMFADHPFGVGPDNYRLEYGKYLGAVTWNMQVYSNNMYLELLAGSGFIGLGAFVLMLLMIPWRAEAAFVSLGVFLIHGLVDVFLMTTPIYFCFWILMGMQGAGKLSLGSVSFQPDR
jgi:hypothetical protein